MVHELLCKLFGLDPIPVCTTCEVLRTQLTNSERERRELLARLLERDKPELVTQPTEPDIPITPQFVPWRVRQQVLESEDRKRSQVMKERAKEISDLEKELGVHEPLVNRIGD